MHSPRSDPSRTGHPTSEIEVEALRFAQELIRIPSVSSRDPAAGGDGESEAARYIKTLLEDVGLAPMLFESAPGRGNLVCRLRSDSDLPALVVHAHLDVVPAAAEGWSVPPFAGRVQDGYLWGRGAADMKGMAAMMVAVARDLARSSVAPHRDIILAFFADEETGGRYGAHWMVENHPELFADATEALSEIGGFTISLPTGRRVHLLATAEKGMAWATLRATGTAGHASMPSADNAVCTLAGAVARIAQHRFPVVRSEPVDAFLSAMRAEMDWAEAEVGGDAATMVAALGSVGRVVDTALRNTATPTVFHGGHKENVIPRDAHAIVDCRLLPGSEEDFKAEFTSVVGAGVDVEWTISLPAVQAPLNGPLVEAIRRSVTGECPDDIVAPYLVPAGTDNKHLSALGIAGYGFTPLPVPADFDVLAQYHATDERIPVAALTTGTRLLRRIFLGGGS
ncbi:M20/M25/M40 family metallo-hydrolase [Mycolicibacterium sp.]|uniref:M20/M25/M40 family metallo-hydrolase n=1 Tax=Mycolicibacterium sp. TaxID=2320850 RepID=UPI003D0FAB1B